MSTTASQSVKISEDLKQELKNMDNASEFIRNAIQSKLAGDKLDNLDEQIEQVDMQAKKESYEIMFSDFQDFGGGSICKSRYDEDIKIEKQYPPPEHYQDKIEQYEQELEKLKIEREKIKSEKDKILLEKAIHGDEDSSPKNHLENIKKNLENINDKISGKRELIQRLKEFKSEIKQKHQERKKLQNELAAEKIKDLLDSILDKLDTSYKQFTEQYNDYQELRKKMSARVSKAGGKKGSSNTLWFENRMSRDIGIGSGGYGPNDLQERHLRDVLKYPRLETIPQYEGD